MSRDRFLPYGDVADEIAIQLIAEAGIVSYQDRAARGRLDRGRYDVARPVAFARRNVAREREVGERR